MMKGQNILQIIIVVAILVILNMVGNRFYSYIDLTEDKRFTLENSTHKLLKDVDENVLVNVLLDGNLDSNFKMLQQRVLEILKQFKSINPNIEFEVINPSEGTTEEINLTRENLRKDGILPATVFLSENDQRVEKLIYPYAIINLGDRRLAVNLLENLKRGETETDAINRSMILLEYKFSSALRKLFVKKIPNVFFTNGNGELTESQTAMLETLIGQTMNSGRINLDSTYQISSEIDILIVAGPQKTISQRSQFIIDQYIMNGGKVIWFVDQFYVNLDSIGSNKVYVPRPIEHGLDDMFFKYGIRINQNVILDLENTKIPQVFGYKGGKVQQQLFSWVYHPLLMANSENAIVRNIDRVSASFPSSIDTLPSRVGLNYSNLLTSSQYSRYQIYPSINISFEIMRIEQKPEAYNKPHLPVAVLVEGQFESFFKNRLSTSMEDGLNQINATFKETSIPTTQLFVSDSDIIKNLYDEKSNRISPLGFNKWEGFVYEGNKDFIINAIDYMLDDYGLVDSRSKNLKVRMLDKVKIKTEKKKWQLINILMPIVLVLLGGLIFSYIRKRKYT